MLRKKLFFSTLAAASFALLTLNSARATATGEPGVETATNSETSLSPKNLWARQYEYPRTLGHVEVGVSVPDFSGVTARRREYSSDRGLSYPVGWSLQLGFHHRPRVFKKLYFGGVSRITQTGSSGKEGDGHYFNPGFVGPSVQWFVVRGLYLQGDVGVAWMTNKQKEQGKTPDVFHEFGIGVGGSVSIGYSARILPRLRAGAFLRYERGRTRVEIADGPSEHWQYGISTVGGRLSF